MSEVLRLSGRLAAIATYLRLEGKLIDDEGDDTNEIESASAELRRLHAVEQERDALKAEMQKLRADAERYRWLFSDTNLASLMENGPPANPVHSEVVAEIVGVYMTKAQADMLVDAAMKGATS